MSTNRSIATTKHSKEQAIALKQFKVKNWSSKKEHKENALALGADERRDKLR